MKMGVANSKAEKNEALRLCRERKRFIKLAMDSRYALVAAHVSYIQSLRNVGIALRRYAEAEVLIESSLSISDKTPSQSTYPSPSPSHIADISDSPFYNESPLSPSLPTLSYMRSSSTTAAVTVTINPCINTYLDDQSSAHHLPESETSWDFFDPTEDSESFRFAGHASDLGECKVEKTLVTIRSSDLSISPKGDERCEQKGDREVRDAGSVHKANGCSENVTDKDDDDGLCKREEKTMVGKKVSEEREDPSEFITHRAKDFLSSIKDIEHRFIRASESGREVSRLLEANRIRVGYCEAKGNNA